MARRRVAGIDVGGTFTDLLIYETGPNIEHVRLAKIPTTAGNQADGVLGALAAAGSRAGALDLIIHGTTTTTNAVLERKLAKVGLITTRGFRDSLELGRRTRPRAYGMTGTFEPLIPRQLRLEVDERIERGGRGAGGPRRRGCRGGRAGALAAGLRKPSDPLPACLCQPGPRACRRHYCPRALAQWLRNARTRTVVGVSRVRARHHRLRQRRRAADPRSLRAGPDGRARGAGFQARSVVNERQRRHRGRRAWLPARRQRPSCRGRLRV